MTRIAYAAVASIAFIATYSLSPLLAVGIAAFGAAVMTAIIAVALRQAEMREIEHVMTIIDACAAADHQAVEPLRLVS
jgi:F0F1-type ATP synthase membrane subunit c/vacuolar-type H+-ATPase subunit K